MMLYACATLLLFSLHTTQYHATAAPVTWSEKSSSRGLGDHSVYFSLREEILNRLRQVKEKRTRADGGFFSRHDAMSDYLQSAYANEMASDLYGPGKK